MRADDRGIEFQFALLNVARRTLPIVEFRQIHMVLASREIDIVVARSARRPAGLGQIIVGLLRADACAMAGGASARIGREHRFRIVVNGSIRCDKRVRPTCLNARQTGSPVDLVNHNFEVEGKPGIRVGRLRRVAQHTKLDAAPGAEMEGQRIVAGIASRRSHHVADIHDRRTIGNKIERRVRVGRPEVEV